MVGSFITPSVFYLEVRISTLIPTTVNPVRRFFAVSPMKML